MTKKIDTVQVSSRPTCVYFIVEGDTEIRFYKKVMAYLRQDKNLKLNNNVEIEYINLKGVGNYQATACRKFQKAIQNHSSERNVIFLCYDSDAVDYTENPPFHYEALARRLKEKGGDSVYPLKAVTSIESWFLLDESDLRQYLKLPKTVSFKGCRSQKDLCDLFKKAHKVYVKGNGCQSLIDCLDIGLILEKLEKTFDPLYKILGVQN